jgi:hypothetical protein
MRNFSLGLSILSLFVSCTVALMALSRDYKWAGDTVYSLSMWSGNAKQGMTLKLYGIVPIGYCYLAGANAEEEKRCVIGSDRYRRFNRPSEQSEG